MALLQAHDPVPEPHHTNNNLPHLMTTFIGRERELGEIVASLPGIRLLTLMGTGGTGKTRLALKAASELLPDYPDGVWCIDLTTLFDPALVPSVVAATLGLRETPGTGLVGTLIDYLQPLKLLLILDNCEHLVEACSELADNLLRACSGLQIIATSRMPLGIAYEVVWRVPPLSVPEPTNLPSLEAIQRSEAVRLFTDRARLRRPDFAVTAENAEQVVRLCHSLDGLPLALELAAGRVRVLSVEQIVARLDERFRLLTSGTQNPTQSQRQQTLTALMDWSYDLLSPEEKSLLSGLSVFRGSFTLEAVTSIWAGELDEIAVIDLLTRLVDKSLVIMEEQQHEARYRLLETIRRYASTKLEGNEQADELHRKHRDWYMGLAERSQVELLGTNQSEWLEKLDLDNDNLRAAFAWSVESDPDSNGALRLAGALVWFWYFRGHLGEGRHTLSVALDLPGSSAEDELRAKGLNAAGALAYLQSDYKPARTLLEAALAISSRLQDLRSVAFSYSFLGQVLTRQGDPTGEELCRKGVEIFRSIGDIWGLALALDFLGEMAWARGDDTGALALHEESLALYRKLGDKWGIALEISNFGRVALRRGDFAEARSRLQEALTLQSEVGDRWSAAWTMHNLGDVARCSGDNSTASNLYGESMTLFEKLGEKWGVASSLHMLGHMAQHRGDHALAESLFDDSLAFFRQLGDKRIIAHTLYSMGDAARRQGDMARASALFTESLQLIHELGDRWGEAFQFNWLGVIAQQQAVSEAPAVYGSDGMALCGGPGDRAVIAQCLEWFAMQAARTSQWERAAKLLGAAAAVRDKIGAPLEQQESAELAEPIDKASQAMGRDAFQRAMLAGRQMSVDAAITLALRESAHPAQTSRGAQPAAAREANNSNGLTRRELEVLPLVSQGMSDTQIAEQLNLSMRTVQAHLRSIYTKLDVSNRAAATRYAIDHGLL